MIKRVSLYSLHIGVCPTVNDILLRGILNCSCAELNILFVGNLSQRYSGIPNDIEMRVIFHAGILQCQITKLSSRSTSGY